MKNSIKSEIQAHEQGPRVHRPRFPSTITTAASVAIALLLMKNPYTTTTCILNTHDFIRHDNIWKLSRSTDHLLQVPRTSAFCLFVAWSIFGDMLNELAHGISLYLSLSPSFTLSVLFGIVNRYRN